MRGGIRVRMKGLWVHPRSGIPYHRSRKGGKQKLTPLPTGLPFDHPDFLAAFAEAARGVEPAKVAAPGTIASTWSLILASDDFAEKSTGYQAIIKRQSAGIIEKGGTFRATAVTEVAVRRDLAKASNPGARWRAWRMWATIGVRDGWLTTDPTKAITKPKEADGEHPAWSTAEIVAFRNAYPIGSSPRAIAELAYWTGARVSDVVKLGPRMVDQDGVLVFTQTKTGDLAYVPWSCPLPAYAAHMERDRAICKQALEHIGPAFTFLEARGRPRSHKGAGATIIKACKAIGMDRSIHGLRKARAVALAEAGGTAPQIASWSGHRSLAEVTHYIAEMDRQRAVRG